MTKDSIVAISSGAITAFINNVGLDLIETAMKGFLGGVVGYMGKEFVTWAILKIKKAIEKSKSKKRKKP